MGASWRRGSAVALLVVAAALSTLLLPPATAGSAADPEVADPAGDQTVEDGGVPVVPGVNDESFDDVDIVAAYVTQFSGLTRITVATTDGWSDDGAMEVRFTVDAGPTSLANSTASGRAFTVFVNGTDVAGLNGTAATTTDGLRIDLPTVALGAVGGDLLSDLTVTTSRTEDGFLVDLDPDDQTGSDEAGPGRAYMFERPPVSASLDVAVVSVGGKTGAFTANATEDPVPVVLRITNLGVDADAWQVRVASDPPLEDPPVFAQAFTPIDGGATAETTVPISLVGMDEGPVVLTFTASSERGAQATASTTITVDLPSSPPSDREVKPAGLTFLTPGAEAMGLDDAFGAYGEAFLLALIVLLTILAIFLLLALGRSTTQGGPAAEAPSPAGARATPAVFAGPGGLAETVRASPARKPRPVPAPVFEDQKDDETEDEEPLEFSPTALEAETGSEAPLEFTPPPPPASVPTAAAGSKIRIEEVRHSPREPEAGQGVKTEVILRNDGPSATLRIALSVDGKPAAERVVQVPSRATKAVELPWTAGAGDNRVRIQAFPA